MNLKTYTLAVSLAATIGLLLAVVPLIGNALEYRSPSLEMKEPQELSSLEVFVTARNRNPRELHYRDWERDMWEPMYEAAKAQHAEAARQQVDAVRNKAKQKMVAYGSLGALCVALLITHLAWARRIERVAAWGKA